MFIHETISCRTIAYEAFPKAEIELEAREQVRQARIQPFLNRTKVLSGQKEWELWVLRAGLSPECGLGVHRIGIYTDFT